MKAPLIAQTFADIVPAEKVAKITGLDYMLAILYGELPVPPISQTMNYRLLMSTQAEWFFAGRPIFLPSTPWEQCTVDGTELCLTAPWRALFQPKLKSDFFLQHLNLK